MENAKQNNTKKYSSITPMVPLEAGKLPPQALEFEQAVLGALMIDSRSVDTVINIIQENTNVFYRPEHREIYTSIINLYRDTKPIDMLTVSNDLRKRGVLDKVGGDMYLVQLTQKVTSAANVEHHARVVQQKYFQRSLIELSSDIISKSYDDSTDVFDLLDEAEGGIFEITNSNIKKSYEKANILVPQAIKRIQEQAKKEGGISGLPSGFKDVDAVTAGWQNSDLIVIAARPGMGKTAFVVSMARNMAVNRNIPVALFSLEMSSVQLITRMISAETGIPSNKLREGSLDKNEWDVLLEKTSDLAKSPMYIDETPGLSLLDFRSKARRLVAQGVKIIFIDYLQLMTVKNSGDKSGNREQEISLISRTLKAVAKDLNIPIIALSQLSRGVEAQTGQKRPMLQHLRESGAIEQDADIVGFIYRPEYYDLTEWDDEKHTPCEGQAEFIIAKHRNGDLKNIKLRFEGYKALFSDLDTAASDIANSLPSGTNSPFAVVDSFESRINNPATASSFNPQVLPADAFQTIQNQHDDNDEVSF
ncbi:MAG: replicative DNA helicase [Flavobacteriales bacterium]|nr:replicative DNA helicase [Flavobacteriales bacterium]